jgi:protein-S-isoprenylcysteine O-methyltransferase Ste14
VPALYRYLFPALWLAWIGYWWISSRDVKPTARREPFSSRIRHIGPLVVAALLLALPNLPLPLLRERFAPPSATMFATGATITAVGLIFSVWARRHLGRNWSGTVTIKEDHELITTGPYGIVRHPIYTGLLVAFVGSAIAVGEWRGIVAVLLAFLSFLFKLRIEERWMRERFGDAYRAYCRRVPALVPFVV